MTPRPLKLPVSIDAGLSTILKQAREDQRTIVIELDIPAGTQLTGQVLDVDDIGEAVHMYNQAENVYMWVNTFKVVAVFANADIVESLRYDTTKGESSEATSTEEESDS